MPAAVRADRIAHVLHNAENGHVHHFGHLDGLSHDHAHQLLRAGHDDDAVHRQGLKNGQRHIAGSRRHVHKHEVHILPQDLLPELLDSPGNDRATPYHGGLLILQQQVDGHQLDAGAALHRVDGVFGAGGRAMDAEQLGDGRAGDVGIQHGGLVTHTAHRNGQHGAGHAFADAALAGYNADHFFDVAARMGRLVLRLTAFAVGRAAAAIVCALFTHKMDTPLKKFPEMIPVYHALCHCASKDCRT